MLGKNLNNKPAAAPASTENAAATSTGNASTGNSQQAASSKTSSTKRENAWSQLAEKYGDGRTKLSKKVTEDMSKLLTDAMDLADMGAKLGGSDDAKSAAIKSVADALGNRLSLTPDQLEKVKPIISDRINERMSAVSELASAMKDDPEAMMETILAGDALSRNEMTQEEYDAIAADTLGLMRNVSGFALSGRGGNDLSDPLLAEQLNSVLTPEQQQTLAQIAQQAADAGKNNNQQMPFQNGNLPAMELEKLDAAMANAQKLTTGLKAMMEGLQGMKDAFPQQPAE